ncbi:gliding motility-associated C-terminal domain-containing protein [Kaistella flava (ex Peng et al. 2021)]|uniref:Gliding motility-associated C-terminal domain-containing protein n=1 Tax=Kaistella flava (ex Peng et al. 2021) TaxID=2038776 RepID=A0A7M2YBA0_9FLAO|nr:gliding motility-associated C-terminal domain-containing protein [Kaistella flava (ex Peng et al. 2021)]QOW11527.1 gliding motility-associated C-terminal domain-containing protein [Kaistella flava (ex Peng et al. 2021)]
MKFSKILLIVLLFFGLNAKAQLDLEHWFPPLYRTASGFQISEIYFYLSTDKVDPFTVKVYNNNVLLKTLTISKSSPAAFQLNDSSMIYVMTNFRVMKVISSGIHITGEKSFYASLRVATGPMLSSPPITDVFASKGKSALGKEFYTVMDQNILYGNNPNDKNYVASVMATKDNTHVRVSEFDNRIIFSDGSTDDELNFTLNKGESFIVAADKKNNNPSGILDDNDPNLIGAKITSDQPVVVSNGNFISQDVGEESGNMNFDQTVPTSKIGKEYFIVNGMTKSESGVEKPLFLATKDNTKIYFNDDTTPFITLNKGQHFIGPYPNRDNKWIDGNQPNFVNTEPITVPTRGMYIRSSEPIYFYQLIGGFNMLVRGPVADRTWFSSGMLFSYPLDKNYLPDPRQKLTNTIQIPSVEKIGVVRMDNKITVKTEDNATILYNGAAVTNLSPIVGKPGWSYFTRPYNVGDINITSNKSLIVDVVGGYPYAGFGSSYTGFSNDPFIIKNGNCIEEGVYLYLNNTDFISFQWQRNGVDILGATSSNYTPTLPGNYTCVCFYTGFSFTTDPIFVDVCPYTLTDKYLGSFCHSFVVSPSFSPPRIKEVVKSIQILTQPLSGTAIVDGEDILVKINEDFSGENRMVYRVNAESGFYEIFKASFTIYASPTAELKNAIFPKSFNNRSYVYDLTESTIANPDSDIIKYYRLNSDAESGSNEITGNQITSFVTNNTEVFARVITRNNCYVVRKIDLIQTDIPDQPGNPNTLLPNVFSPNDDGINDVWDYSALGNMSNLQLAIFDRYGTKVYEHGEKNKSFWDGKSKTGMSYPTGTYWTYYILTDEAGTRIQKAQWILLKNAY